MALHSEAEIFQEIENCMTRCEPEELVNSYRLQLKECYNLKQAFYIEKVVPGKVNRSQFAESDNALNKKAEECLEKISQTLKSLN